MFKIEVDNSYIYTENNLLNFSNTYQYSNIKVKFLKYTKIIEKQLTFLKQRFDKLTLKKIINFIIKFIKEKVK